MSTGSFLDRLARGYKTTTAYTSKNRGTLYRVLAIQIESGQPQKVALAAALQLGGSHVDPVKRAYGQMSEGNTLGEALLEGGYVPITDARAIGFAESAGNEILVSTLRSLGGDRPLPSLLADVIMPYWFKLAMIVGTLYGLSASKNVLEKLSKTAPTVMDTPIASLILFLDQFGPAICVAVVGILYAIYSVRHNGFGAKRKLLGPLNDDFRALISIHFCRLAQLTGPLAITTTELVDLAFDVIPSGYAKKGLRIAMGRLNNQEGLLEAFRGSIFTEEHQSMFGALSGKQTPKELMGAYATLELQLTEKNTYYYERLSGAMMLFVFGSLAGLVLMIFTALISSVSGMTMG